MTRWPAFTAGVIACTGLCPYAFRRVFVGVMPRHASHATTGPDLRPPPLHIPSHPSPLPFPPLALAPPPAHPLAHYRINTPPLPPPRSLLLKRKVGVSAALAAVRGATPSVDGEILACLGAAAEARVRHARPGRVSRAAQVRCATTLLSWKRRWQSQCSRENGIMGRASIQAQDRERRVTRCLLPRFVGVLYVLLFFVERVFFAIVLSSVFGLCILLVALVPVRIRIIGLRLLNFSCRCAIFLDCFFRLLLPVLKPSQTKLSLPKP